MLAASRSARAANSIELGRALNNLAMRLLEKGDLIRAVELLDEAIEVDERIGSSIYSRFARGGRIARLVELGGGMSAMTAADRFIAESEIDPHYQEVTAARRALECRAGARGHLTAPTPIRAVALAFARQAKDPQADRAGDRESDRSRGDPWSPGHSG